MTQNLICNGKVLFDMADGNKAVYTFKNDEQNIMFSVKSKDDNAFDLGDCVLMTLEKKG